MDHETEVPTNLNSKDLTWEKWKLSFIVVSLQKLLISDVLYIIFVRATNLKVEQYITPYLKQNVTVRCHGYKQICKLQTPYFVIREKLAYISKLNHS